MVNRAPWLLGRRNTCIEFLEAPEIHRLGEQRDDVRIESFPVRIVEVVLLGLFFLEEGGGKALVCLEFCVVDAVGCAWRGVGGGFE